MLQANLFLIQIDSPRCVPACRLLLQNIHPLSCCRQVFQYFNTSSWRRTTSELHYNMQRIRETKHSCWYVDLSTTAAMDYFLWCLREAHKKKKSCLCGRCVRRINMSASTCDTCMHREKDHKRVNMRNEVWCNHCLALGVSQHCVCVCVCVRQKKAYIRTGTHYTPGGFLKSFRLRDQLKNNGGRITARTFVFSWLRLSPQEHGSVTPSL